MLRFCQTAKLQRALPTLASLLAASMSSSEAPPMKTPRVSPLLRSSYPERIVFEAADFKRQDESPDPGFYVQPRFVQHIDDAAIELLKRYYGTVVDEGDVLVDVCSSWTSHLPDSLKGVLRGSVGYGLNAKEMAANPHLGKWVVRDLNSEPSLREVEDGSVDVVICNVSIDYLTRPVEVLGEVRRVLRTGGVAHLSFSNRCFPTKVIGKWLSLGDEGRRKWVGSYFWAREGWEEVQEVVLNETGFFKDPLFVVRARKAL